MNSIQLKANFQTLIDNFKNDDLLSRFYDVLSKIDDKPTTGKLWNKLTSEQQAELIELAIESEDESKLIPH